MGSGNTLLTSLCICSSGSFTGWGVSAPWCPVGWCMSGDVLCLATSWELTTDWRLNLGSPPCGPHSECWFLPHKGGTSTIIQAPSHFLFPAQLPHLLRLLFMFPSTDTSTAPSFPLFLLQRYSLQLTWTLLDCYPDSFIGIQGLSCALRHSVLQGTHEPGR
jgi:hypothetical protein